MRQQEAAVCKSHGYVTKGIRKANSKVGQRTGESSREDCGSFVRKRHEKSVDIDLNSADI